MKNNLMALRSSKNLTQQQLCDEFKSISLCVDRSTYSRYENGSRQIPVETLIKIAKYYKTSTDYILCLTENPSCK